MVAGHLQEKHEHFYIVLNYSGFSGKRVTKWIATGLPVKGNKRKAEKLLLETRQSFEPDKPADQDTLLFSDYMREWLKSVKPNVEATTYASYTYQVKQIGAYFDSKRIALKDLTAKDIQDFYTFLLNERGVTANTVIHSHANIRKALQYAVRMKMITTNPALDVDRPKIQKFIGSFYDVENLNELFAVVKGHKIELAVKLAAFYGLRRSEVVGLKWDAIDFHNKKITIRHTVSQVSVDGKYSIVAKDRAKTKSSLRSLPLVAEFEEFLLALKTRQEEFKRLCGRCYNYEYDGYIYVDEMGNLIRPNFITQNFEIALNNNGLKKIRFHDLRHSCASLLLANGVSLKEIQEWLGHSDFSTTANIYAHLDKSTKTNSANAILASGLKLSG